jgi:hypothetical protein
MPVELSSRRLLGKDLERDQRLFGHRHRQPLNNLSKCRWKRASRTSLDWLENVNKDFLCDLAISST